MIPVHWLCALMVMRAIRLVKVAHELFRVRKGIHDVVAHADPEREHMHGAERYELGIRRAYRWGSYRDGRFCQPHGIITEPTRQ